MFVIQANTTLMKHHLRRVSTSIIAFDNDRMLGPNVAQALGNGHTRIERCTMGTWCKHRGTKDAHAMSQTA